MSIQEKKIIIVGAGVFGLSTAWHMSQQGYRNVIIFDRQPYDENAYDPACGCDGASADVNKIYRCSYGDEIEYQDLAFSGRSIWQRWNQEIATSAPGDLPKGLTPATTLYVNNGLVRVCNTSTLAHYDSESLKSLEKAGLRDNMYLASDSHDRKRLSALDLEQPHNNWARKLDLFSHIRDPNDQKSLEAYLDVTAGFTRADKACAWVRHLCEKAGIKFVLGEPQGKLNALLEGLGVHDDKQVKGIRTADGEEHTADLVIVAAGGWTPSIIPDLNQLLETTGGSVVTVQLPKDRPDLTMQYAPENFPVLTFGLTGHNSPVYGGLYGFPRTEAGQIKIGYRGRKWTNYQTSPITGERVSTPRTAYSEFPIDNLPKMAIDCHRTFIETFWPDLTHIGIEKTRLCWYTDSNDNNFVIDYVPGYNKSLFICTGGSGHGFKFLPVLGKHVINQIEGKEDQFTKLWRYRKPPAGETQLNGLEEGENGSRVLEKLQLAAQSDWLWPLRKVEEALLA